MIRTTIFLLAGFMIFQAQAQVPFTSVPAEEQNGGSAKPGAQKSGAEQSGAENKNTPKKRRPAPRPRKALPRTYDIMVNDGGQFDIYGGVLVVTGTIEWGNISNESSGSIIRAQAGYGFSPMLNLFVRQSYQNYGGYISSTNSGTNYKGFGNTGIGVKGLFALHENFSLYYEGGYSAALLEPSKEDRTNAITESTGGTERPSAFVSLAAVATIDMFTFGAGGGFTSYQEGESEITSAGVTVTEKHTSGSGNSLTAFAQLELGWKPGVLYTQSRTDSYDVVRSGVATTTPDSEVAGYGIYVIVPWNKVELGAAVLKPEIRNSGITSNMYYGDLNLRLKF